MNSRKVIGSLVGFVVLAGVSYHQVRDEGPDPRDTAIMAGTAVSGQASERARPKPRADEDCERPAPDAEGRPASECADGERR